MSRRIKQARMPPRPQLAQLWTLAAYRVQLRYARKNKTNGAFNRPVFCPKVLIYRMGLWTCERSSSCPFLGRLTDYSAFLDRNRDSILNGIAILELLLVLIGYEIPCWSAKGSRASDDN